jgi:branched-chain amino acid transport system permease protein
MEAFLQQIVSGLAAGGIYAAVALALVMTYLATNAVNFAQGEMAMFSTFVAWALIQWGVPYWAAFFATLGMSFLGGIAIERAILRPLERAPVLAITIVTIGLLAILNSMAGWIFGYTVRTFPSPFPESPMKLGGVVVSRHSIGSLGVTLALLGVLYVFFRYTHLGLAMRAAARYPVASRLVGIRVGWMLALGWGLASVIGAVAGILIAPVLFLDPNMMEGILIYAFASATLGGFTSPVGAVVGGFLVGIIENLAGTYIRFIGTDLKLTVALAIIVLVLIFKPGGLFGRPQAHHT